MGGSGGGSKVKRVNTERSECKQEEMGTTSRRSTRRCRTKSAIMPGTKCRGEKGSIDSADGSLNIASRAKIWCIREIGDFSDSEKSVLINCVIELLYYCTMKDLRLKTMNGLKSIASGEDLVLIKDYERLFEI